MRLLGIAGRPRRAALLHLAAPHPAGGWLILTVRRTEAAFEEFARERLLPAARALGISPVRPQIFPIHELLARPNDQVRFQNTGFVARTGNTSGNRKG